MIMRLTKDWISKFISHSNGIEGIDTPKELVYKSLRNNYDGEQHPYIINQVEAIEYIKKHKSLKPDLNSIRELHGILLKNIDRYAGVYRPFQVYVGRHVPPKAEHVLQHLDFWCHLWGKKPVPSWSRKKAALVRHYEFEWIHPFTDGNGRVGRLLLLWDCLHHKTSMDIIRCNGEHRYNYYADLQKYHSTLRDCYIHEWR